MRIKRREREAIISCLAAGLVPKIGLELLQVGRKHEVAALLKDIDCVTDGGSFFRIVVGNYGTGKSFLMNLIRTLALQKRMVVVQADMTAERRLHSSKGQARALYAELMANLSIKSKPDGNALKNLCESWISDVRHRVLSSGGSEGDVSEQIVLDLRDIQDFTGGFEFASVLAKYYEGYASMNDELQAAALRWLRAEYTTKTDARSELGVRRIISDDNFYDGLKLMSALCRKAGYSGLLVNLDEMVVLSHRLPDSRARQANYEVLLTLLNDSMQGGVQGMGFLLAGTEEFLEDKRRGLYSYDALRTRLSRGSFGEGSWIDVSGPVIRLPSLTPEELFVLLRNIRYVHSYGEASEEVVPDDALKACLAKSSETLGAEYFRTPREVVRMFTSLLNILEQNPQLSWREILQKQTVVVEDSAVVSRDGVTHAGDSGESLEGFKL